MEEGGSHDGWEYVGYGGGAWCVVGGWWLVAMVGCNITEVGKRLGVWRTQGTSENELGNYEHDSATPNT